MKKLLLVLIFIFSYACVKPVCCTNISTNFNFYVIDAQGNDLLDSESANPINLQSVKVYYLINGKKISINRANLDAPQMYVVYPPEGNRDKYNITLYLNIEDSANITTTYFEWDKDTTDVFEAEISRKNNNTKVTKVWLNDILIWDVSTANGKPLYELVK